MLSSPVVRDGLFGTVQDVLKANQPYRIYVPHLDGAETGCKPTGGL
jgi:hypothetical protein